MNESVSVMLQEENGLNLLILFSQPWGVGGAETHTEALIQGLKGHKVYLAVNRGGREDLLRFLQEKYPYLEVLTIQTRGANVFRWLSEMKRLRELIEREKIDGIFAQQRTAGIWSYQIAKKTKIPYTVTMHDPWHRAMFKTAYRKIFPCIFTVSRNLARILQQEFDFSPWQIREIDNGVDFTAYFPQDKQEAKKRLQIAGSGPLLLHVSRFSRIKGAVALRLLEAIPLVLRQVPDLQMVIIGEGPLAKKVEERVEAVNRLYGPHVTLRGFVNHLSDWYNAADLLIGEGRVAVEALACHTPVVAIRNDETFIGAVTPEKIIYACDVNFDGRDQTATPSLVAAEILGGLRMFPEDCRKIAAYIKERLSIEQMTRQYLEAVDKNRKEKDLNL